MKFQILATTLATLTPFIACGNTQSYTHKDAQNQLTPNDYIPPNGNYQNWLDLSTESDLQQFTTNFGECPESILRTRDAIKKVHEDFHALKLAAIRTKGSLVGIKTLIDISTLGLTSIPGIGVVAEYGVKAGSNIAKVSFGSADEINRAAHKVWRMLVALKKQQVTQREACDSLGITCCSGMTHEGLQERYDGAVGEVFGNAFSAYAEIDGEYLGPELP